MKGFNQAMVMGNLTRDPEIRYIPSGTAVATFGVATNRAWKTPEGEKKEEVEFHDVVVWGKLAELANQYLKKGNGVFIVGRLKTRSWDGQDGVKRHKTEIIASEMNFVGGPSAPGQSTPTPEAPKEAKEINEAPPPAEEEINIEEIPF